MKSQEDYITQNLKILLWKFEKRYPDDPEYLFPLYSTGNKKPYIKLIKPTIEKLITPDKGSTH